MKACVFTCPYVLAHVLLYKWQTQIASTLQENGKLLQVNCIEHNGKCKRQMKLFDQSHIVQIISIGFKLSVLGSLGAWSAFNQFFFLFQQIIIIFAYYNTFACVWNARQIYWAKIYIEKSGKQKNLILYEVCTTRRAYLFQIQFFRRSSNVPFSSFGPDHRDYSFKPRWIWASAQFYEKRTKQQIEEKMQFKRVAVTQNNASQNDSSNAEKRVVKQKITNDLINHKAIFYYLLPLFRALFFVWQHRYGALDTGFRQQITNEK